ncbi:MAG: hypothetical protein K2G00_07440, partial [Duncaniella sp.]|nr:hypothetical protein [Duncaniella sp.]
LFELFKIPTYKLTKKPPSGSSHPAGKGQPAYAIPSPLPFTNAETHHHFPPCTHKITFRFMFFP